jgi:hypothetical protein
MLTFALVSAGLFQRGLSSPTRRHAKAGSNGLSVPGSIRFSKMH